MKGKSAFAWGIIWSTVFGLLTMLAIHTVQRESGSGWLNALLAIIFWPLNQILFLIASVFPSIDILQIASPVSIGYMCLLGFFVGFFLSKLYSKLRIRGGPH